MDYTLTLLEPDHGHISVVGHSRLGKTALLAGAMDERFYCAFFNDSGCSGSARFTLLADTGHNSWDCAYAQKELFDWMLEPVEQDTEYADSKQFG